MIKSISLFPQHHRRITSDFGEEVFSEHQPALFLRLPCLYSWSPGVAQKASVYTAQLDSLSTHRSQGQNQVPKFLEILFHVLSFTVLVGERKTKKKQIVVT